MTTSRTLWLDPSFGASGDMLLGAMLGLGAPLADVVAGLEGLAVGGWTVEQTDTIRNGISATRAAVSAEVAEHHRSWSSIDRLLAEAMLPTTVSDGARRTFRLLGEIEAEQHRVALDEVHFHEVGAIDALVDIVGVWLAVEALALDSILVGPVGLGHGTVKAAHGQLPIPAPATLALLRGAPIRSVDAELETCTPTGAALLCSLGTWGPLPDGTIVASARGAGGWDPDTHPNVVSAILIEGSAAGSSPSTSTAVDAVVLSTNVDDVSPEVLGRVIDRLLVAGADDAWVIPMSMKKNRPAHQINALTAPGHEAALRRVLSEETGTLGIRVTPTIKHPLPRSVDDVEIRGAVVTMKVGPHGAKPEYDHLVALSDATGVPVRTLADEARLAWQQKPPPT